MEQFYDDYFEIRGENGFIKLTIGNVFGYPNSTSHFGGYETQSIIEIQKGSYKVRGTLWTTTGELFKFYDQLTLSQSDFSKTATFDNYEQQLKIQVKYSNTGQTEITGSYQEYPSNSTELIFEIEGDQSYIQNTLTQLKSIVNKFGDLKGVQTK